MWDKRRLGTVPRNVTYLARNIQKNNVEHAQDGTNVDRAVPRNGPQHASRTKIEPTDWTRCGEMSRFGRNIRPERPKSNVFGSYCALATLEIK